MRRATTAEEVGDPSANYFESEAEAEKAIESLRALGDEWDTTDYRVVRTVCAT